MAYTSNRGESGTALQANGGAMFWQPDRKKLSSYNNLLFEKEKQSTSRKGKNARKRQSMATQLAY